MLAWLARGLRLGRVTTRYPDRGEAAPDGFQGPVRIIDAAVGGHPDPVGVCPVGAIARDQSGEIVLDRGRCVLCGECVRRRPDLFAFEQRFETAARTRGELIVQCPDEDGRLDGSEAELSASRRALGEQARALRRSIHIRHLDAGSDGSEEWEIQALWNPYYDIQRLGFFLTASPRHADILLVTGGVTEPMRAPLERTWEVMPEPKALIAVGSEACSGGLAGTTPEAAGGVDQVLPVDVYIPGAPPSPIALIDGLLLAVGLLRVEGRR